MLLTKTLIKASVIYCVTAVSSHANELVMSNEQLLMVSGSVKGVGCVSVNADEDITVLDEKKALLKAKSTLLTSKTVSGKETLNISKRSFDGHKVVSDHFSDSERVAALKPIQVFYFHETSKGFYCVKI